MSVLDEVINQASIREMLDYYGVEKQGKLYVCPFHNDTHASLSVTDDDKHWQCFTCGEHGNIDNLVEKMERLRGNNMDYVHRVDMIIKLQNLNIEFTVNDGSKKTLSPEQRKRQRMFDIMRDAMMLGENSLNSDTEKIGYASRYLADRKISKETQKAFHIGFNDKSFLQDNLSARYNENELFEVGVLAKTTDGKYYDHEYNRLLIPIFDSDGRCVAFGGRYLEELNNNGGNKVKYKNTKVTEIFKKSQILFNYNLAKRYTREANELVIVEGYFDAVSAYEMGLKHTVALMGVELTQEHMSLIEGLKVPLTLCLDNDGAGRTAMYKIIPDLLAKGFEVNVINTQALDKGKDMNDFLVNGITKENLMSYKIPAIEFLFNQTFEIVKNNDDVTLDTVQKVYNEIFKNDKLNNSGNEVRYFEYVSRLYGYTREDIISVCKPTQNNTLVNIAMEKYFCSVIKKKILAFAEATNNNMLQSFITQGRLLNNHIVEGMNNEKYIQNNCKSLKIVDFCNEYVLNLPEFKEFEKNYDGRFEKMLNNVFVLDKRGEKIKIEHLTAKQKDVILKQFDESFSDEEKQYVKDNIDRFIKLYVADSIEESRMFLGNSCPLTVKDNSLNRFSKGNMSLVNYAQMYPESEIENFHRTHPCQYTTEDGSQYQCVLMFNNVGNKLQLTPDNYMSKNIIVPSNDEVYEQKEESSLTNVQPNINGMPKARGVRTQPTSQKYMHNQETTRPNE